eukprot:gnl/TRDRNA2_/TRDRNA2_48039_c0_seq2.p1 gnl/TRDRNA2_/TRDRNA2_48039_c0~~gnl/TRDRNA2_/TRDRNA2_48039_c0_seq2.p1  ORF type:complete len:199 (-),score=29.94 gnl/TRDRNA2_/TRDRNA2_48039_c0_seq2:211-807(-)
MLQRRLAWAAVAVIAILVPDAARQFLSLLPVPAPDAGAVCGVIVVLGYALDWDSGNVAPNGLLERRLRLASRYAARHSEPALHDEQRPLIVSGGVGRAGVNSEAAAMARWLLEDPGHAKVSAAWRVLLEESSTSTRTNAIFSLRLLEQDPGGMPNLICVATNQFHRWRSWKTFMRAASPPEDKLQQRLVKTPLGLSRL